MGGGGGELIQGIISGSVWEKVLANLAFSHDSCPPAPKMDAVGT